VSARQKMHADEFEFDVPLVARLVAVQFPQWADLRPVPVDSAGTDNALYRLGEDMVVRLPRIPAAVAQVDKEHRWLPELGPQLPLAIPVPLVRGAPGEGYPWPWSIYGWLEGATTTEVPVDLERAARQLAGFVAALHRISPDGGPRPGAHNFFRGVPLAVRDGATRHALDALQGMVDVAAAAAVWEDTLGAPVWPGPDVWLHGDLQPANLLGADGDLSAVIDFGCVGVGDPACDVMVAWTYLSAESRPLFRSQLAVDDATWARGRGWALSMALIMLPYYTSTNPVLADIARHTIGEVLADAGE
jgi:aminoglycoside phosphotransferase (APT) family kinase protein